MQNSALSAVLVQAFALLALPIRLNNDDWLKIRRPVSRIGGFCFFHSLYKMQRFFWYKFVGSAPADMIVLIWR